jgi:hypothetical protein
VAVWKQQQQHRPWQLQVRSTAAEFDTSFKQDLVINAAYLLRAAGSTCRDT